MDKVEPSFVPTVFTHNRNRLLAHDVAHEFLLAVVAKARGEKLMPCAIELLKTARPWPKFYEFSQYRGLVEAADKVDTRRATGAPTRSMTDDQARGATRRVRRDAPIANRVEAP